MLRFLGAVLVFGGPCFLGWQAGVDLQRKNRQLQDLIAGLERMARELTFRLTPLPELLVHMADQTAAPIDHFFLECGRQARRGDETFLTSWKTEAERLNGQIDRRAVDSLIRLGHGLGRYDWEEEERLISVTIAELKGYLREGTEECSRCGRLYRTLGAAAGAMLVILLC